MCVGKDERRVSKGESKREKREDIENQSGVEDAGCQVRSKRDGRGGGQARYDR